MQHSSFESIYGSISAFQIIFVVDEIVVFSIDDINNEIIIIAGRNGRMGSEESNGMRLNIVVTIGPWIRS